MSGKLVLGVSLLLAAASSFAGSASGQFTVQVNLNKPGIAPDTSGYCTSQTLSADTNAIVTVVCSSGQFVSIEPQPGKPFLGTHGGAFRYYFGPGISLPPQETAREASPYTGAGTVTTLRIGRINGADGPLELLVSF